MIKLHGRIQKPLCPIARIASDVSVMITVVMVAVHWIQLHDTMLVRPNNKAANGTAQCLKWSDKFLTGSTLNGDSGVIQAFKLHF